MLQSSTVYFTGLNALRSAQWHSPPGIPKPGARATQTPTCPRKGRSSGLNGDQSSGYCRVSLWFSVGLWGVDFPTLLLEGGCGSKGANERFQGFRGFEGFGSWMQRFWDFRSKGSGRKDLGSRDVDPRSKACDFGVAILRRTFCFRGQMLPDALADGSQGQTMATVAIDD